MNTFRAISRVLASVIRIPSLFGYYRDNREGSALKMRRSTASKECLHVVRNDTSIFKKLIELSCEIKARLS